MKPQPTEESDGGVTCWSNSNGDPDYDVKKLMDWNGDWLPPPEQWSDRKGFTDRHFGASIERWMNGCPEYGPTPILGLTGPHFRADREIAPSSWIPAHVDGMAPHLFWQSLSSRAPDALSDIDISERCPWWDQYQDSTTPFLTPIVVPEAKIDQEDEDNKMPGAKLRTNEAIARIYETRQKRELKIIAKRNRLAQRPALPLEAYRGPDRSLKPSINMYLRPARVADTARITVCLYYLLCLLARESFTKRLCNAKFIFVLPD